MSLLRRWFDPIRSRWFFNRPYRQRPLPLDEGLVVYLRSDDAYSYLIIQLLAQLQDLLIPELKPIKIIMGVAPQHFPNQLSEQQWQQYSIQDASVLATQHGFVFDGQTAAPTADLVQQARDILQKSSLEGAEYLHLLQDVFHMLWQNQRGKLNTLHQMMQARQTKATQDMGYPIYFTDTVVSSAYIQFGGKKYRAIDDFLRLTRRLKKQKLLTGEPIFLINHIEWGEHLVNDPEELADVQALQASLDIYLVLEDPISWLILAYIKRELADYYNIVLQVHPLPYQQRDQFDWPLVSRLARRTDVHIAPFCRPSAGAVDNMAWALVNVPAEQRPALALDILQACWCQGLDPEYAPHFQHMLAQYPALLGQTVDVAQVQHFLAQNQAAAQQLQQPDLPIFVLSVNNKTHVFNSLYRVWQIESLLAEALALE